MTLLIMGEIMESWRKVWREGRTPLFSVASLEALATALRIDDPALIQGANTDPPATLTMQERDCQGGCFVSYAGWKGHGLKTLGQVEEFFAKACYDADARLKQVAACRWLLNWFDDTPRDEMRRELLVEVERALTEKAAAQTWQPTPESVNALPEGVREFVHDLQTRCDPAGEVARCRLVEDENRMLRAALTKILEHAPESEPTRPEYGGNYDDEYTAGSDGEHWRLAQIAREVLGK